MRVLITRAEPDASVFAERCRAAGLTPILAPVMEIDFKSAPFNLEGIGALAFTSANGVRAIAKNSAVRNLPVFAVGAVTAEAARAEGFADIRTADGDVESLSTYIASERSLFQKELLHVAGEDRAGDLVELLKSRGVPSRRQSLYKARALSALSADVVEMLKTDRPEWITFFSPRTARLFLRLAEEANVTRQLTTIRAVCLSEAVAEAAGENWRVKTLAPLKTAESVIEQILSCGGE